MSLLNFAHTDVVTATPNITVAQVAKLMSKKHVGSVVIVRGTKPVGIITDRDITVRVVSQGKDPQMMAARQVMTRDLVTLSEDLGLFEVLEIMKNKAIRRFPVVDSEGNLSGLFTLDDILYLLGVEMSAVARIIEQESPGIQS